MQSTLSRVFHTPDDRPLSPRHGRCDSLFSPVRLVKYSVEATRVGQITDYDKLVLEVWTDGRITPDDALKQSASILKHHLDVFDRVSAETFEFESQQPEVSEEQNKLRKLLNMSVNEIEPETISGADCGIGLAPKKCLTISCRMIARPNVTRIWSACGRL